MTGVSQQVTRQLEFEKAALLEKKRREVDERRRKQEELDHILLENRRKVTHVCHPLHSLPGPHPAREQAQGDTQGPPALSAWTTSC